MKLSTLANCLILAPIALCLAQTPANPPALTPKPPVVSAPAATAPAKPALSLEDVPGADPVVITIGDERVTKSEFERLLASLPEQARAQAQSPAGKKKIAQQVAELKSLAQEARKRGMDR